MKYLGVILAILILQFAFSCSDESQVEGNSVLSSEGNQKGQAKQDCDNESAKKLRLLASLTFYSSEIQGVLGFCKGCHGSSNGDGGLNFTTYDTTSVTLSDRGVDKNRMVEQVASDHEGSYTADALAKMQDWQSGSFPRGTKEGGEDDSPFYEDGSGDPDSVDLDDFDPFSDENPEGNSESDGKC